MNVFTYGIVIDSASELPTRALRIAAQAQAALYHKAMVGTRPIAFVLESETLDVRGKVDESLVYPGGWLTAFWYNLICRHSDALNQLCDFPLRKLKTSSTSSSEFRNRMVPLLQSFWRGEEGAAGLAKKTLEAPKAKGAAQKWIDYVGRPVVEVVGALVREDGSAFAQALTDALSLHRQFWSSSKSLRADSEGFLAIELCGLAAVAFDRGIRFSVDSEYLPGKLVDGTFLR